MISRKVSEDKILLKVSTVTSYKTVPITPTLTGDEVERFLRKKMNTVESTEGFRLYHVVDQKETLVAKNQSVWSLHEASPNNSVFSFKPLYDKVTSDDHSTGGGSMSKENLIPPRPKRTTGRNRSHSKAKAKTHLLDDVSLFRGIGTKANNDQQKTVWVRFKDKHQQLTLNTAPGSEMESCIEQCCAAFDVKVEDFSQYILQEKVQSLYLMTVEDLFSAPTENPLILVLKPDVEVKKCIETFTQTSSGPVIRDTLKVIKTMAKDEAWKFIIPMFLFYQGLPCLLSIIDNFDTHPSDTLLLALKILVSCVDSHRLPPSDHQYPLPSLSLDPTTIHRLTSIAAGSNEQSSNSVRIAASDFILKLIDYDPSCYLPFYTKLRQLTRATRAPPPTTPLPSLPPGGSLPPSHRPASQRGPLGGVTGGGQGAMNKGSSPPFAQALKPLVGFFVEHVSSDVIVSVSMLNLISLVISRAPLQKGKGKGPENAGSKEELLQFLFEDLGFTDKLHRLAVNPGRVEVEKAVLVLQEHIVEASFWEKDEVFERDNEDHEMRLRKLWGATYPDIVLDNRVSKLWKRMGFQSDDPTRDFRAMGLLGLKHLIYIASHQSRSFRSMCDEMHSRTERFYPIATAGMLVSQMLDVHLKKVTEGDRKVLPCLFDGGEAVGQLYCTLMKALYRLFDERHADYMDFHLIREELKELFEQSLEDCPTVRLLGQHLSASEEGGEDNKKVTIRTTAVFQWGLGTSSPSIEFLGSLMSKPVLSIAASSHVVVVTETEGVWGWGACSCGQLGFKTTEKKLTSPVYLDNFSSKQITKVFANDGRTAGTTATGELWMCGEQVPAQEGEPPQSTTLRRVTVGSSGENGVVGVTKVAFGQAHGAILVRTERSGKVYTWGHNSFLQLGHSEKDEVVLWPKYVAGLSNMNVVNVSAGRHFCVAYGSDRSVVAWGNNLVQKGGGGGLLGTHEKDKEFLDRPKVVRGFKPFTVLSDLVCGNTHIVALTKKGQVLTWGEGKGGKLGLGSEENYNKPKEVNIEPCAAVSAGYNYTLALGKSGKLYSWGEGGRGALGHGDLDRELVPKEVLLSGKSVKCEKMSASTCGLTVSVMLYELPSVSSSVFGVPLARLMTHSTRSSVRKPDEQKGDRAGGGVPYVVRTLCEHVESEGRGSGGGLFPDEEKYRAMKGDTPLRLLRHCFESTQDVDMGGIHPQTSVALLIHWVEELPSPIVAPNVYNELVWAAGLPDPARKCAEIGEIIYHQMNSHSSGVFRYLLAWAGRLMVDPQLSVRAGDLEFFLSVVCGLRAKGVGGGLGGRGVEGEGDGEEGEDEEGGGGFGGGGGGREGKKRRLFSSLVKDIGVVQFPFYVTLLGVLTREGVSPLRGAVLRELWGEFVALGMPQRVQSQLLWRLRDCRALGEKRKGQRRGGTGKGGPPVVPPSYNNGPTPPIPSSSSSPKRPSSPPVTRRGSFNAPHPSRRPLPPSRPPPSPLSIIIDRAVSIEKEIQGFFDGGGDPVEEWETIVGLIRKLVVLRIDEMALTPPPAHRSMDDLLEVVSEVVGFLKERLEEEGEKGGRLDGYHEVRGVLDKSVESIQQYAPHFSLGNSSSSAVAIVATTTTANGVVPSLSSSFEGEREWGWSNLQQTHLVSKEFHESTCALSALGEGMEADMKVFLEAYVGLKKKWEEMREKEIQIQGQLRGVLEKLLPFFEKVQQAIKESGNNNNENNTPKRDISSFFFDSIEAFTSQLQNILSQADHRADVSIEEREKMVQAALDMQEYIDRTCQGEAFGVVRQNPRWAASGRALDTFLIGYLSSNLSHKTDGLSATSLLGGGNVRASRSATLIASSRVSTSSPRRVGVGKGGGEEGGGGVMEAEDKGEEEEGDWLI